MRYKTDEHGNVVGYLSDNVQPFSFEYKKIRVTKERAEKLIRENNLLPQNLLHVSSGNLSYALLYRIEK